MVGNEHVFDKFESKVMRNIEAYKDLLKAIDKKTNEKFLHNMIATQLAFAVLSLWEAFLSDILLSYVVKKPNKMLTRMEERVNQSIKDKFGNEILKCVFFKVKKHLTWHTLLHMIDPKGSNITRSEPTDFTQLANEYLTGRYARKFTLSQKDNEFYSFVKKFRNYLAHGSLRSRKELVIVIHKLKTPENSFLKGNVGCIGPYLKENISGKQRVLLIAERLIKVSEQLI